MASERIFELRTDIVPQKTEESYTPKGELETKASDIAMKSHEGVFRKSGEPYFTHCQAVAEIIDKWGIKDPEIKAAAWVHDVVEDCPWISLQFIEQELSPRVAFIVNGVSKFVSTETGKRDTRETHRKVLDSQYVDLGVAFVKLADRVHNMSTLKEMTLVKQKEKSEETLQIYAPLAEALGMWDVKNYLEDSSFSFIDPELYTRLRNKIDTDPRLSPDFLAHYTSYISHIVEEQDLLTNVNVRVGGYWSLYKKQDRLSSKGLCTVDDFSSISDVVSIRLKTVSDLECYRAIGIIHGEFGQYVDYTKYDEYLGANKQSNGYEALQTTLTLPEGNLEIAVTTEEKEQFNRWGVIQKLKDHQTDMRQYQLKSVIIDDGEHEVVRFLHRDATGVDLAYSASDLTGASLTGIVVNDGESSIVSVLPNASRVSLIVGQTKRAPDKSLLNYVLPQTKKKIEQQLILAERDTYVARGEAQMEEILSSRGFLSIEDIGGQTQSLLNNLELQSLNELFFYMGKTDAYQKDVEHWLERKGITKEQLHITSILVTGQDQSGILSEISSVIFNDGGNIRNIHLSTDENEFKIRLVVENLSARKEEALKKYLSENKKYSSHKIV